jgi:hypothetical protein
MRWGIFWRTLRFSLEENAAVINASMLLHNFILDERMQASRDEDEQQTGNYFQAFSVSDVHEESRGHTEAPDVAVTDNNQSRPAGRPSQEMISDFEEGCLVRDAFMMSLWNDGFRREHSSRVSYNAFGHVVFN